MRPISFTVENGITLFHHDEKKYKRFLRLGKRDGNVGLILKSRKGNILTCEGFGTIEHPCREMITFSIVMLPHEECPDEERLASFQRQGPPLESFSFGILDFSKPT